MPALFSPLTIKDITFKNRIGVSPMCQYSAENGLANDWHLVHLGSFAVGGAGLVMTEATGVSPDGRITPGCLGIWSDEHVEALRPITKFITDHGAVAGIQIAHSGRKGSAAAPWDGGVHLETDKDGWDILSPCDQAYDAPDGRLWKVPQQISLQQINDTQTAFVEAAKRALAAGFKLLEIHGAHGYLLNSFTSPLVNKRDDVYGGNLKSRARMLLEVTEKVRAVWPRDLPLAVRLSTTDWDPKGLSVEDNIQIAKWLKDLGVDIIDCSSGGATPSANRSNDTRTSEQVAIAARIKQEADIMTMAVGGITEPHQADDIISSSQSDFTLLARQMLRDPYWAFHAAQELGADVKAMVPVQKSHFVG